ncbi:MAG: zinc ribbon domain-containing protein [Nanoarchaeota archaeon]
MNCKKCEKEINPKDRFCTYCGAKTERDLVNSLDETIKNCQRVWFVLGFLRRCGLRGNKKAKWLKEFEDGMKKTLPDVWEEYNSAIMFWREQATKNEKEKAIRPKSKSI